MGKMVVGEYWESQRGGDACGCVFVLKTLRHDRDLFLTFQNSDAKSHHCLQTPRYTNVCIDSRLQTGVFARGKNACVYSCRVVDKAARTFNKSHYFENRRASSSIFTRLLSINGRRNLFIYLYLCLLRKKNQRCHFDFQGVLINALHQLVLWVTRKKKKEVLSSPHLRIVTATCQRFFKGIFRQFNPRPNTP